MWLLRLLTRTVSSLIGNCSWRNWLWCRTSTTPTSSNSTRCSRTSSTTTWSWSTVQEVTWLINCARSKVTRNCRPVRYFLLFSKRSTIYTWWASVTGIWSWRTSCSKISYKRKSKLLTSDSLLKLILKLKCLRL